MSDHSHSHSHDQTGHSHTHSHGHNSIAEANKAFFNKEAHSYDAPLKIEFADRMAPKILSAYPFNEDSTTLLDYACGTGLISKRLAPYTKSIVGVDISQGMIDQYNLHVSDQGIEPDEMQALCVELKGVDGELDGRKFDVAIVSFYSILCSRHRLIPAVYHGVPPLRGHKPSHAHLIPVPRPWRQACCDRHRRPERSPLFSRLGVGVQGHCSAP